MIYDDYMIFVNESVQTYGSRTVVWMQVGSFYEMYAVETREQEMLHSVCSLLNIQRTRKNKSIIDISASNYQLAGLPVSSSPKHIDILIKDGWTIVLVDQTGSPPNIQRSISQVLSPATYVDSLSPDSQYLMCIYLVVRKNVYAFTVAYTDVSTGSTYVVNAEQETDSVTLISDLTRFITAYRPKEIVFISSELPEPVLATLRSWFRTLPSIQDRLENIHPAFFRLAYQTDVLRKTYPDTGLLSPIEFVGLERHPESVVTLVYLFQFVYEHNESLLRHIQPPTLIYPDHHMHVSHSSMEQLNLLGKTDSVLHSMNMCATPMGRRLFAHRLATPITDPSLLRQRYDLVDVCSTLNINLSSIKDIERMHRRIQLGKFTPADIALLFSSIEPLHELSVPMSEPIRVSLSVWHQESLRWNLDMKHDMDIYPPGRFTEMDTLRHEMEAAHQVFRSVIEQTNRVIEDALKVDINDRMEYSLTMTKKRFETYTSTRKRTSPVLYAIPISNAATSLMRITFDEMDVHQRTLTTCFDALRDTVLTQFQMDMDRYAQDTSLLRLSTWISELDVAYTCSLHARKYHYVRPDVHERTDCFIRATEVRHPLIERILTDVAYVANPVQLEKDNSGLLLYGINFSGKSSYMKSVGVNLLLAQAGMFVAADTFSYTPYDHLFTRIPSGDNMFKGQSTFVVEMNELRSILKQSTNRSLVIGDEISSGTETVSGISIVAASLLTLSKRGTSFLFATHLHEVAELKVIQDLSNVTMKHMSVHYDESSGVLVYDRILRPGTGDTLYGLEVCQSMNMPPEFMLEANRIRQTYLEMSPTVVATKQSSYNATLNVDVCSVCNRVAEEVHHIQEQYKADEKGMIGRMHKNARHNLMNVCTTCHDKIHAQKMDVKGYQMTTSGVKLIVEETVRGDDRVKQLRDKGKSFQTISRETGMSIYHVKKILN